MKHKILSFLTAFAMVASILVAPFAKVNADNTSEPALPGSTGPTKIVVHKVLMNEKEFNDFGDPKEHDGSKIEDLKKYFGKSAEEIKGVAFRIYEVKEKQEAGFTQGSAIEEKYKGDLDANKYYKLIKNGQQDFFITGDNGTFEATLEEGNYRIIEDKANSTYNAKNITGMKAVPFDLKLPAGKPDGSGYFTVKEPLHIYPKNTEKKVEFDKNFAKKNGLSAITDPNTLKEVGAVIGNYEKEKTKATADIGKKIPYHAKAELPKETFFRELHLADTFDRGIEFVKGSMKVSYNTAADGTGTKTDLAATTDYEITETTSGFTLKFTEAGLKKLNDAAKTQDIYVDFNYDGVVTTDAVVDDEMDNNITITYNHEPPKPSPEVTPNGGKITVTKTWNGTHKPSKVKYVLTQDGKSVADVTFTAAQTVDKTDLDNNIKFKVTGDWSGEFTGLKNDKTYKVQEFADGTTPEYTTGANGVLNIANNDTPTSITPTPPKVVTGGKKFVKVDSKDDNNTLEGAQFKIWKNGEGNKKLYLTLNDQTDLATNKKAYDDAQAAYLKAIERRNAITLKGEGKITEAEKEELTKLDGEETVTGSIKQLKKDRDEKFVKLNLAWKWTDKADDAYIFTSNKNGGFEVKGLAWSKDKDGTTTNYYLEETKAPAGYELPSNKDKVATFVIGEGSYNGAANGDKTTHLDYKLVVGEGEQAKTDGKGQRVENIKVSIPKTGGIGSIIFVVAGLTIMGLAAYKMKANKEQA